MKHGFYTVSTPLNGVILAGSVEVRSSVTKCTIMYYEQTAGQRSANFCIRIHVDKAPFQAKFYPSFAFIFKVKDSNRVHWEVDNDYHGNGGI